MCRWRYVGESLITTIFEAGKTKEHYILLILIALIKLKNLLYSIFWMGRIKNNTETGGEGGHSSPIGLPTKIQNKENTRVSNRT